MGGCFFSLVFFFFFGGERKKSHALLDTHLKRQSKVINSQAGDCKLNYLDGEPGCGGDQQWELVSHLSISKAFRGRERSCELLNSREGSVMIKANLHIAGQPYKSTVWNSHLRPWLIFQAPGCGVSTCIFGPFRAKWTEVLMTIGLFLISGYKRWGLRCPHHKSFFP